MSPNEQLFAAIYKGDIQKAKLALDQKADINAKNEYGYTPLHMAVLNQNQKMIAFLLYHGAKINIKHHDATFPLRYLITKGNIEIIKLLLDQSANNNDLANEILFGAATIGNTEMMEHALIAGADIDNAHHNADPYICYWQTPLEQVIISKNRAATEWLLSRGARINYISSYISNIDLRITEVLPLLEQRVVKNDVEGVKQELLDTSKELPLEDIEKSLLIAIGQGHKEIVTVLLDYLVAHKSLTDELLTKAQHALAMILKRKNIPLDQHKIYEEIQEALLKKIMRAPQELTTLLTERNIPEELKLHILHFLASGLNTPSGQLLYAAMTNNKEMAKKALHEGAYINAQDPSGRTALHYFAYHGNQELVDLLVTQGADRDLRDLFGNSAAALARSFIAAHLKRLAQEGATKAQLKQEGIAREELVHRVMSPQQLLFLASQQNNIDLIERALREGARTRVAAIDDYNRTPLHYAADTGNQDIIRVLLVAGADPNAQDSDGRTALHYLALANLDEPTAQEIAALLMSYGANSSLIDYSGITPIKMALNTSKDTSKTLLARTLTRITTVQ